MSTSHCEIIEERKVENFADVRMIEPPRNQINPYVFKKQKNKKTWKWYSKQAKRFSCKICVHRSFKNATALSWHFNAMHIPKTGPEQLELKRLKQLPKITSSTTDREGPHNSAVKLAQENNKMSINNNSMNCHVCQRRFNSGYYLLMHIKAKHTPRTLLILSLRCVRLFMNISGMPVPWVSETMSTTQNPEAGQLYRATLPSSHRERPDIKAPIKDFQEGPVPKSRGQIKSFTTTESLHAPMKEDIELGDSWSNSTKNKTATHIPGTRSMRNERNNRYIKKGLENNTKFVQNRNTDMQIIPKPSTVPIQGIATTQIPPDSDAGIKRQMDEHNSNNNSIDHQISSEADNIFSPMSNEMGNEENSKTNSDEPRMEPMLNDYQSPLPMLNFSVGCNICNKYFKNIYVLLNHMKLCHVRYRCEWCGFTFSSRYWLIQHLASIHNIQIQQDCRRVNGALNLNKGYWRRNVKTSNAKARRTFPNDKSEPAFPNVKFEPAFPNVKVKPAFQNVKIEPAFPNVKIEPAFVNVKIEPAFPNVKIEPAFPNVKVEPVSANVKVEPIVIKVEPVIDL